MIKLDQIYELLSESFSDVLWTMNLQLERTYISPTVVQQTGFTADETLARPIHETMTPQSLQHVVTTFKEALKEYQTNPEKFINSRTYELEVYHKEGHTIWLEVRTSFIIDKTGTPTGVFGISRDITERKKVEHKLTESKQLLQEIIENLGEGICLFDKEERILFANPAAERILGIDMGDLVGTNILDSVTDDSMDVIDNQIQNRKQGLRNKYQIEIKRPSGQTRTIEITATPQINERNKYSGSLGILRDITDERNAAEEQERLKSQLRQVQKLEALGTLAGGIAHDFNNLLYIILGNARLSVRNFTHDDNHLKKNLQEIVDAGERAADLVKQVLTFARKGEHKPKPVLLQPIIKESIHFLRNSIPTTIQIKTDISATCPKILADPTQIHQVVMNLGTNAYHAMRSNGGVMTIGLRECSSNSTPNLNVPAKTCVRLWVSDSGHGMTQDILERVMEPFFTTKKAGEGTGMGLSTVHGIIKNHNGGISIASEPGKGTRFEIYFPVIDPPLLQTDPVSKSEIPMSTRSGHVVVVDDEPMITRMATRILKTAGHRVSPFTDSQKALSFIETRGGTVDCIITDQTMPGLSGINLARAVLGIYPQMPIAIITGYSESVDKDVALREGIKEYLEKPLSHDKLEAAVERLLVNTEPIEGTG